MSIPLEILGSGVNLFVCLFLTGAKFGNGTMLETRGIVHPVSGANFGYVTFADVASHDEDVRLARPPGEALRMYSWEANLDPV